jgi:hypothetical protein
MQSFLKNLGFSRLPPEVTNAQPTPILENDCDGADKGKNIYKN